MVKIMMGVLPNGLFSLSLANLWFLIPLGHDVLKCSSNNGPLELLSPLGTFFGDIGFNTLIVFPSVENRPCHFSWISFEKMSTMTSTIQKFKHLNTNKSPGIYWRISVVYKSSTGATNLRPELLRISRFCCFFAVRNWFSHAK